MSKKQGKEDQQENKHPLIAVPMFSVEARSAEGFSPVVFIFYPTAALLKKGEEGLIFLNVAWGDYLTKDTRDVATKTVTTWPVQVFSHSRKQKELSSVFVMGGNVTYGRIMRDTFNSFSSGLHLKTLTLVARALGTLAIDLIKIVIEYVFGW